MARTPNKRLNITDETLRNELINRGQQVGPIVESTRDLYQKILIRLMSEEQYELNESLPTDNRDVVYEQRPIRYRYINADEISGVSSDDNQHNNAKDKQLSRISIINRKSFIFVTIVFALIIAYYFIYY